MKPTFDSVRSKQFPVTDYNYQSVVLDSFRGGCARTLTPSFRDISSDYFKNEARHDFAGEAIFFAMIIITAALPVLQNLHALAHFIRAISGI